MRRGRLAVLFGTVALARAASAQFLFVEGPLASDFEAVDELLIAKPVGSAELASGAIILPKAPPERKRSCFVQRFEVVTSSNRKSGSSVTICFVDSDALRLGQSTSPKLQVNRLVVLGLKKATAGVADCGWIIGGDRGSHKFRLPIAAEGVALFGQPTSLTALPKGKTIGETAQLALSESLSYPSDSVVRSVVRLLVNCAPPMKERPSAIPQISSKIEPPLTQIGQETALTRAVWAVLPKSAGYRRSKVAELLVRWRLPKACRAYGEALKPLLKVNSVYLDPSAEGIDCGLVRYFWREYGPIDVGFHEVDEAFLASVTTATNPRVLVFWLQNFGNLFSQRQMERFATLLKWDEKEVLYEVITTMASQLNEPEHDARPYGTVNGREVLFPDIEEKRAYWKRRFGIR